MEEIMSGIAWDVIITVFLFYLLTLPPLILVASETLVYNILATHPSQRTIRRFLASLLLPLRTIFVGIYVGLSQEHLDIASQHLATSKGRYKKWALVITRLGFSLIPMSFVITCILLLVSTENIVERVICASLAITDCIIWYFAIRFGHTLKTMTADDSDKRD
jgi:hypothetical protein